jgi:hypothetical protein
MTERLYIRAVKIPRNKSAYYRCDIILRQRPAKRSEMKLQNVKKVGPSISVELGVTVGLLFLRYVAM